MVGVLESVKWGSPALNLLTHCQRLDAKLPAVMHIRHSERPRINNTDELHVHLNSRGREAAYEFGSRLTGSRRYRLYHSSFDRTRETAEEIARGVLDAGGKAELVGALKLKTILNRERYDYYIERDFLDGDTVFSAIDYFNKWTSGRYPPDEILPSIELSRIGAKILNENLGPWDPQSMAIYVSHDTWVAAFQYHWFGIAPNHNWINFLDGFIFQPCRAKMIIYNKEGKKDLHYPHWWNVRSVD
ncbi:MAG: histidine phosphatase family protein [Candidatus Bathyarchaeota archaeon]|jgi:broad specificity phosphatase PhoE